MYFLPIPSRVNSRCQWIFVCQSERGPMLCSHVSEWRRMLMLYNSLIWYFQQCYVLLINLGPVFWIPKQIILMSLQQSVTNCSASLRSELLDLTTRLFFEDDHRTPIIKAIHWSLSAWKFCILFQVAQIGETKPHKSKKCGILHCVHKYEHFVRDTERLFDRKLERRTEIEKVGQAA